MGQVVNFTPWLFTPRERSPCTQWIGGWVSTRVSLNCLDTTGERKISYPYQELNTGRPAHSSKLYQLSYPGFRITSVWPILVEPNLNQRGIGEWSDECEVKFASWMHGNILIVVQPLLNQSRPGKHRQMWSAVLRLSVLWEWANQPNSVKFLVTP